MRVVLPGKCTSRIFIVALVAAPVFGVTTAHSANCFCVLDTKGAFQSLGTIERGADASVKLTSQGARGRYSLDLTAANADSDLKSAALKAGETWRESVAMDANLKWGTLIDAEFHTNAVDTWRDPGDSLRNLRSMGENGPGGRALSEIRFATKLLNDRFTFSTNRQASTWMPFGTYQSEERGVSEQFRFSAVVLKTEWMKFSIDGASSRVDANYRELTFVPVTDPLLARNRATDQIRANFKVDRFEISVLQRDSAPIVSTQADGFRPHQVEIGTSATIDLSDLRGKGPGFVLDQVRPLLPDTVWVSRNQGSVDTLSAGVPPVLVEKLTLGGTRNWSTGDAFIGYWQSAMGSPQYANASRWGGQGWDAGGNLYFGNWLIYGSMSLYSASNLDAWSRSAETSVSGSLLVTWKPVHGPALTAGLLSYQYGYGLAMREFGGMFDGFNSTRYEFAADFSRIASETLDWNIGLKFLASYRANMQESQWEGGNYANIQGRTFMGFRFTMPLQS